MRLSVHRYGLIHEGIAVRIWSLNFVKILDFDRWRYTMRMVLRIPNSSFCVSFLSQMLTPCLDIQPFNYATSCYTWLWCRLFNQVLNRLVVRSTSIGLFWDVSLLWGSTNFIYLWPFDLTVAVFFTRDMENIFAKFELGMPDGETDDGAQYVMRRATGGAHSSLWLPCGNRQRVKAQPHGRRASESQLSLGFCLRAYSARRNTKAWRVRPELPI